MNEARKTSAGPVVVIVNVPASITINRGPGVAASAVTTPGGTMICASPRK